MKSFLLGLLGSLLLFSNTASAAIRISNPCDSCSEGHNYLEDFMILYGYIFVILGFIISFLVLRLKEKQIRNKVGQFFLLIGTFSLVILSDFLFCIILGTIFIVL